MGMSWAGESEVQVEAGATSHRAAWKGLGIDLRALEKHIIYSEVCP
jgi:hypothetical protein